MGLVGPVISPAVAVLNSGIAIAAAIQAGDPDAVFSDVFSAPANVVGAVFNGATLDLTALTPLINDSGLLGTTKLNSLDIAFGGLFTPGSVGRGSYDGPVDPDNPDNKIPAPGGSIFNSIGLGVDLNGIEIPIPGQAIGPIGALEGVSQTVGALLGDGWDGKSGRPTPPLAGVEFPTISDKAADNWAAAIQKLADTLLGKKDSETTPSPDTAKTAAAVATTSVALNSVESESAKAESAKTEVAQTESSSTPAGSSAESQTSSAAEESTSASPTAQPSSSQPSSSATAPASSSTDAPSESSDSTQGSASSGSSTSNADTDADTTSPADTKGSADAGTSSSSDTSSKSSESSGAASSSSDSTSSASTD